LFKLWTESKINTLADFVCKTATGYIEYFQLAWQIASENTAEREFGSLEKSTTIIQNFCLPQPRLHKTEAV